MKSDLSFGAWLKHRRRDLDLTQAQLGQQIGCSTAMIRKIEANRRRPSRQLAALLAHRLGIPPEQEDRFVRFARAVSGAAAGSSPAGRDDAQAWWKGGASEPVTFPSLSLPNNLPSRTMKLIGRQRELALLDRFMADKQIRLVTIVGAGGMGKTRLAIAAAEQFVMEPSFQATFPHGVYWVSLAPLTAASQIGRAIAAARDAQLQATAHDAGANGALLRHLRQKKLLLILDNFEHLLDGAAIVSEIIQAAPGVKIIVTSRERLRLREEQVFPIEGLSIPDSVHIDHAREYPSVALFMEKAQRVLPSFSPNERELAILIDLCRRLEGMPLAIELAAGWVDTVSLADIASELQSGIDFLETDLRNVPARHRSMRAVFDSSWQRLGYREQAVLGRLCLFRGGFTREAAKQVAGASLPLIGRLVNKSLLQFQGADQRYHLHELLRQYGLERVAAAGQLEAGRDAHSVYFLNFVRQREADMKGRRQVAALREISDDFDNVRLAWLWAAERRNYETVGGALHSLIWVYCDHMRRFSEGIELQQIALNLLAPAVGEAPHPVWYRLLSHHMTPRKKQIPQIEQALAFAIHQGDQAEIAWCKGLLGWARAATGDVETGIPQLEEAICHYRELGDRTNLAHWLLPLGNAYRLAGQMDAALAVLQEALSLYRAFDDLAYASRALYGLAESCRQAGKFAESEARFHQLIEMDRALDHSKNVAIDHLELAYASFLRGDFEETERLIRRAAPVIEKDGDWSADFALGLLANLNGDHERAWRLHQSFLAFAALKRKEFEVAWGLSITAWCLEQRQLARQELRTALEVAVTRQGQGCMALALPVAALLINDLGETKRAVELMALGHKHLPGATGWLEEWSLFSRLQADMNSTLGPATFDAAWKRGQHLNLWATARQLIQKLGADRGTAREVIQIDDYKLRLTVTT